eukprot:23845-Chlamydomonas_euryale.AAC.1
MVRYCTRSTLRRPPQCRGHATLRWPAQGLHMRPAHILHMRPAQRLHVQHVHFPVGAQALQALSSVGVAQRKVVNWQVCRCTSIWLGLLNSIPLLQLVALKSSHGRTSTLHIITARLSHPPPSHLNTIQPVCCCAPGAPPQPKSSPPSSKPPRTLPHKPNPVRPVCCGAAGAPPSAAPPGQPIRVPPHGRRRPPGRVGLGAIHHGRRRQ